MEPPSVAPCAILVLLRQEEFSFAGVARPVTFRVSVYSMCKEMSFSCLTLSDSHLVQHLIEILGIEKIQIKEVKIE